MEITKRTNTIVKTAHRFIILNQSANEIIRCPQCGEPMTSAQVSADFFGISNRKIYLSIEAGEIHFTETEANKMYVCPTSVRAILKSDD